MQISDVFQVVLKQNEIVSIDKAGYYNENWEKMVTRKENPGNNGHWEKRFREKRVRGKFFPKPNNRPRPPLNLF